MSDKYRDIPEGDRKKAETFFDRGRTVAGTGNFDYAIEMFIQGLNLDPEKVEAHLELREISLKRKASGGKAMGFFEARKYSTSNKDDKLNMLNAEKLLAHDPGNVDYMLAILQNAHRAGFFDTAMWIGPLMLRANADSKRPSFDKFMVLKDIYKDMAQDTGTPPKLKPVLWKRATEACQLGAEMKPDDMDVQTELKHLGAEDTMSRGGYSEGVSFRDSIKDRDTQQKLMETDKDHQDATVQQKFINEAEAQYRADPNEPGKLLKLVDALEKTEDPEHENRAIELLSEWFERTKAFKFRKRIGEINMKQWSRMERGQRQYIEQNKGDAQAKKDYEAFLKDKLEFELGEFQLWSENYPTEMMFRFHGAERMFYLKRFDEAIPLLQDAQRDAKYRIKATILLGRAFYELQFYDEATETLDALIRDYQLKGDELSKDMYYWSGRAHEARADVDVAIKLYSQIVRWEFNYRDVQKRIKDLRGKGPGNAAQS